MQNQIGPRWQMRQLPPDLERHYMFTAIHCCCSVTKSYLILCDPMNCSTSGFPVLHHLLEFGQLKSTESVMPSNHLILCCPLHLLPSISFSIRVFSSESALLIRQPNYWSFIFSINPSYEYSVLISFKIDWCDLLAVQAILKSLLQHHHSKASVLQHSTFFMVQLSHPHMTTGKSIALTRWTFVGKVMSLLLNMLFRLVITFLPRSKHLLISWLQSPSAVILKSLKIKSVTVSTVSPSINLVNLLCTFVSQSFAFSLNQYNYALYFAIESQGYFLLNIVFHLFCSVLGRILIAFQPNGTITREKVVKI